MIDFFAYSVSHDFRSPVASIYDLTKLLKEKYGHVLDEKGKEYRGQSMKTAELMVSVADQLNADIRARKEFLNFETVKVKEIKETFRNQFMTLLKQRRINWSKPTAEKGLRKYYSEALRRG